MASQSTHLSINNNTPEKRLQHFTDTLQQVMQQYRDLWENYKKLQEIHARCNRTCINCSSQIEISPIKKNKSKVYSHSTVTCETIDTSTPNSNTDEDFTNYKHIEVKTIKTIQTDEEEDIFNFNKKNKENQDPVKRKLFSDNSSSPTIKKNKNIRQPPVHNKHTCKNKRAPGRDCWKCKRYYESLPIQKKELEKRINKSSRHRSKYPRPVSPKGFWNPVFSDTD